MNDRIEQEITINASLDRVWELVSRPGWWVPAEFEQPYELTPGAKTERVSEKWGRFVIEVVRIDPQMYAAFRWASMFPGEEPASGKSTLVEFAVKPAGDAVSVTVTESGFGALDATEAMRKTGFEDNTKGWGLELADLKVRAEK